MTTYQKFVSDYCKTWEKSGKEQFIKTVTQYVKDEGKTPLFSKSGKLSGLSQSIYDVLLCGLRGNLKKDAVVAILHDITTLHADIPSIILDVTCILDAETCTDVQSEDRTNFCYIVRELESFISDKLLKERLEIDTLQDVGTLKNKNFYTKFIKIKTKLYYKQRKFNLFREESEGYAKLIVELNQEITEDTEWKTLLEIIQSLIGCFNLDPNRVLDIILESFEARPHLDKLFISLIKNYMVDPQVISEVLGFKLGNMEVLENYKEPPSLMTIIALLLQHGVISLDDIYPWLRPDDIIMAKEAEKEVKSVQDYIRKLSIVSTKGPQANGSTDFIEEKADPQEYWSNQKLVLCEALLKVNAWREFSALSARLPTTGMAPRPALALCAMLHALIEPLYRTHCRVAPKIIGIPVPPLKSNLAPRACKTFLDMKETVIPALIILGSSLHHDPVLMYKIIRILRTSRSLLEDPLHYEAITVLDAAILPALTLMEGNCCMAEEVYTLLKLYPYQCRYCLYSRWKNESGEKIPALMRVRGNSLQRIKHIMKRVSKENIKPQGRLIGKLSHAAPAFLFDYMLLQIQTYDNLIGPVVESLKYLTSLSLDVLGYCLLEALCAGKGGGGAAHPPWLQALAAFAGAAFKKHNIELTALLQFVANRLKAQQSQDLLILKEIVQKMAGIEAAEEMTPDQLDAMAGGELLKGEAGYFSQVRNTRRSSARLKDAVVGNNLDIALCILSAQQRHCCVWKGYGTFLCQVLGTAMRWHADRAAFHRECAHYPGFVTKYRVSNQFTEANDHVGYENYRHVCHKWHYKITKAMVVCLDSGDYVQIRNALIVLIRVLPHFPVLGKLAQIIERKVEKVKEEEKTQRQDLYVLATGYSGQLRNKVPNMMRECDFHQIGDQQKVLAAAAAPAAAKEDSAPVKQDTEATTSPQPVVVLDSDKRESRNSDRRREEADRDKESKRESRSSLKERSKEEARSKERSPRDRSHREERYLEAVSPPHDHRHPPDDIDRDVKRRKVESSGSGKGSKDIEERSPEKEKRKSKIRGDERKERKMSRKRDRAEETAILEQKRRRDEQKAVVKMGNHQNGSQEDHHYEKYHKREKSPFRDRSHEEPRDKHRRSNDSKLRR
ncbi:PREDICTED: THO complex subunit 2 [Papilio polytes]|uniref:THO complex subunit 2 n=1 Tax=Papilio polytes TaxID=76194 RepID=UPI0006760110|nr:PREDICTED: THO complex subunit 2 [Papilio polytes]